MMGMKNRIKALHEHTVSSTFFFVFLIRIIAISFLYVLHRRQFAQFSPLLNDILCKCSETSEALETVMGQDSLTNK